jgi:lysine/ornithine N-monooxygenase
MRRRHTDEIKTMDKELEQKLEQEISDLEQKKDLDEQKPEVVDALNKEIERKKKELYELRESIRQIKSENESLVSKLQSENLDEALNRISKKYSIQDEDKQKLISEFSTRYKDVVSVEKMEGILSALYLLNHPEHLKKIEQFNDKIQENIQNKIEQDISSSSDYSPSQDTETLTPEEMLLARQYNIKPETLLKMKKTQSEEFLTKNAKKLNY